MSELVHHELSGQIIGAAMQVLNELKPGLNERFYQTALALELRSQGCKVEGQRPFPVRYRGTLIGTLIPDLIVNDSVIVDAKVASAFTDSHIAQMVGYLSITGLKLALLLNFKNAKLAWKRVVRERSAPSVIDLHSPSTFPLIPSATSA